MKQLLPYLLVLLLWCACKPVFAQAPSASDYFNRASKEYIKQDKMTALKTLDEALREHPGDARLLKLAEELLKGSDQEQQQEEQQQQQEQEQDERSNEGENDQQQGQNEQQEQGQEGDRQEDTPTEEQQDQGREQQEQQGQQRPNTIAPHDARRILDALEREEKEVQDKVRMRQRPAQRTPIEKDW